MTPEINHTLSGRQQCSWNRAVVVFLTIAWTIFGSVPLAKGQYFDGYHPEAAFINTQPIHTQFNPFGLLHEGVALAPETEITEESVAGESVQEEENEDYELDRQSAESFFLERFFSDGPLSCSSHYSARIAGDPTPLFILHHSWKSFLL